MTRDMIWYGMCGFIRCYCWEIFFMKLCSSHFIWHEMFHYYYYCCCCCFCCWIIPKRVLYVMIWLFFLHVHCTNVVPPAQDKRTRARNMHARMRAHTHTQKYSHKFIFVHICYYISVHHNNNYGCLICLVTLLCLVSPSMCFFLAFYSQNLFFYNHAGLCTYR